MFKMCRKVQCCDSSILQNIDPCQIHRQPSTFICLQKDEKCMNNRLLCLQCLQDHKTHNWQAIQKYFDKGFQKAIQTGTSSNAKQMDDLYDTAMSQVSKIKAKINKKLDQIASDMKFEMQQLKQKYPYKAKFEISGKKLTNKTANQFIQVRQRQRNGDWIQHSSNFIVRMFRQTTVMLSNVLDDFHMNLVSFEWEDITKQSCDKRIQQFRKKYQGKYLEDPHYFKFSFQQHPPSIRVNQQRRQIKFVKASPSKPTAIIDNVMNRWHNIIYFKVVTLDKTILVFDKQLIALGVCLPKVSKTYGYRGVIQPSRGGFTIGSNGKCYHTKLFKYEKADSGFTFGGQDIIKVQLDYEEKKIKFEKITGFFKKTFEMQLGIDDNDIELLKPCVMFHGEQGAKVQILEEHETTKKFQKHLKKKKKLQDTS